MKKTIAVTAILMTSIFAQADIIKCTFTEPFVNAEYSMTQSQLTITQLGEETPFVQKNVSFQIMGPGQFELLDKDNNVVMKLELNLNGSDGMSDTIYPYSAEMPNYLSEGIGLFGGCKSNFLHPTLVSSKFN